MDWFIQVLSTSSITAAIIAALAFISKGWFSTRLKESISSEYKEAFERYKKELERKEDRRKQAYELADFFSIWLKASYFPKDDVNEIRYECQKKYWQLVLSLDAPVLKAVNKVLHETGLTMAHKEALIIVRKFYINEYDDLEANELFHFDPITEPTTEV